MNCARSRTVCGPIWLQRGGFGSDLPRIPPRFWPHLCYGGEGLWFFVGIPSICWLLCASVLQMVSHFLLKYCKFTFSMFYRPFKSGALQISLRDPFNADVKDVIKGSVKGVIKYLINKYHMTVSITGLIHESMTWLQILIRILLKI